MADDQLVSGLRCGDGLAFETLVKRFETPLYRYFLASHGDAQLAGEQSVDCFSELVRAMPKMSGGDRQLRPFVFAVARNVLRRSWRARARPAAPLDSAEEKADPRPTPAAVAESQDEHARLIGAIRSLDPPTRDALLMHYVEQMPLAEVAAAIGEPLGTIKSRLHRGRHRLAALLQPSTPSP
ncbi:ECF RNA polymerase sigma factor SigE [Pseudobythopirellula maris]|uniref:ECF RNA polymerase sigma factor SigE n=1 Tax=Pseudobythopirellula maris TaxID=2527991 RepID=A0A5C5ZNG2_9BACT|nr:sigma-70 family RNA polymerase sigma factor [Pseudobythopirellula maris]TWT88605.1 ECF RNA polymerase sigma factor SigE [Pseudobythopirellula maris]